MKASVTIAISLLAVVPAAMGGISSFTLEAGFVGAIQSGYYLEDFNSAPWTTLLDPAITSPQAFASGEWKYEISSPAGLSGQPMPLNGGAVAPYQQRDALTITFTGKLPTAIGGVFWVTDVGGHFVNDQAVTIKLVNGATQTFTDLSNWDAFTGYTSNSPITSVTLSSGQFATVDHLYVGNVVPAPAAAGLAFLGLSLVGWVKRRLA